MSKETFSIYVNGGILGDVLVTVTATYEKPIPGSRDEGKLLEPDDDGGWSVVGLESMAIPNIEWQYATDDVVREAIDAAIAEEWEGVEP